MTRRNHSVGTSTPGLLVLYAVHAAAGLALEVALMKAAALLFGLDLPAVGTVLAIYVAGLAIGAALSEKLPHSASPVALFAALQEGLGVIVILMPEFLRISDFFFVMAAHGHDRMGIVVIRALLVAAAILPSAIAAGAVFPVICRIAEEDDAANRNRRLASLYALATIASGVGAWLSAFYLLPHAGLFNAMRLVGGAHLLIAGIAAWLARRSNTGAYAVSVRPVSGTATRGRSFASLLLAAVALGAALFASEVSWFAMLWRLMEPTPYVTGTALAAIILSMGLGGLVARRWLREEGAVRCMAASLAVASVSGLILCWSGPEIAQAIYRYFGPAESFDRFQAFAAALALSVVGLPSLAHGAALVALMAMVRERHGESGAAASFVSACHAAGGVVGSLAATFLLAQWVGAVTALAGISFLLGAGAILVLPRPDRKSFVWIAKAAPACALLFATTYAVVAAATSPGGANVIFQHEDGFGLTEVVRQEDGSLALVSNRIRNEGGDAPAQTYLERLQGYIPLLLHPHPKRVLAIGLGTGIAISPFRAGEVESLICVEISPGVIEASRHFTTANNDIMNNPKVRIVNADGRNFMKLNAEPYDLIVQELFFPYASGTSSLYTVEHYREIRRNLAPGGIAAQWISLSQIGPEELRTLVATFQEVFPSTHLCVTGVYLCLIGRETPWTVDAAALEARLGRPEIKEDLVFGRVRRIEDFLQMYLMGPEEAARFSKDAPLQTDAHLRIENNAARRGAELNTAGMGVTNLKQLRPFVAGARIVEKADTTTIARTAVSRACLIDAILARCSGDPEGGDRHYRAAYSAVPATPEPRSYLHDRADDLVRAGRETDALAYYDLLLEHDSSIVTARYNRGAALYRLQRFAEAAADFAILIATEPGNPDVLFHHANTLARLARYDDAAREYREVLWLQPDHERAQANLAEILRVTERG
jgi:spermidine synthase